MVTFLLQHTAVVCLNHAVMPSALRVFSQLFVFFLFKFFMLCSFQITYCTVIIAVRQENALKVIFVNNKKSTFVMGLSIKYS